MRHSTRYVYFITARSVGLVKIGFGRDPQARVINAQVGSPVPLTLERKIEGGKDIEASLHERFSVHRAHGEWFALAPEIEAYMATLPTHEWKPRGWHHAAARAAKDRAA